MSSASSPSGVVLELAEEFLERYRNGERPSLKEYLDRRPDLAGEIREVFPAMAMMENIALADESINSAKPEGQRPANALEQVGDYRILRQVGRGGMGVVYEAEQVSLGRHVALKVLPLSASRDGPALQRFQREARAAARLHHTNIVPVFEVGRDGDTCFYAMQFIAGQGLDVVLDQVRRLPAAMETPSAVLPGQPDLSSTGSDYSPYCRSIAKVGQQAASALAYAHARGILHRDIKPSNLLLDASGTVWITDFGLAKANDSDDLTGTGEVVGTLRFIPPERFRGESDARGDVYSLGLTLYELLTLRPAFDSPERVRILEQVLHTEPPRPRVIDPRIPRDLETIVLKAMAKEPGRRYQSAAELADDLQRFLEDRPIQARRDRLHERMIRWGRRNPVVAALTAAVTVLMLLGGIGGTAAALHFQSRAAEEARLKTAAEQSRARAEENAAANQKLIGEQFVAQGTRLLEDGDVSGALLWFVEALHRDRDDADRAAQHRVRIGALLRQCPRPTHVVIHPKAIAHAEFTPDGKQFATFSHDKTVRFWDVATGRQVGEPLVHPGLVVFGAFHRDGRRLITRSSDSEIQRTHVWNLDDRTALTLPGVARESEDFYTRDFSKVLSHPVGKTAQVVDAATGKAVGPLIGDGRPLRTISLNADGTRVATIREDPVSDRFRFSSVVHLRLWNTVTGEEISLEDASPKTPRIFGDSLTFAADGRRLFYANIFGSILWDAATGRRIWTSTPPPGQSITHIALGSESRFLMVTSGTLQVHNAETGQAVGPGVKLDRSVQSTALDPNGSLLAIGIEESVTVWQVATGQPVASWRVNEPVRRLRFSPDGRHVLAWIGNSTWAGNSVRVWEAWTGRPATPLLQHDRPVMQAQFSPDGNQVLCVSGNTARLWPLDPPSAEVVQLHHPQPATEKTLSADGTRVVTIVQQQAANTLDLRLWDAATGRLLTERLGVPTEDRPRSVTARFSPDNNRVLIATRHLFNEGPEQLWSLWQVNTNQLLPLKLPDNITISSVQFSSDGERLMTCGRERNPALRDALVPELRFQLWDARTAQPLSSPLVRPVLYQTVRLRANDFFPNTAVVPWALSPDGAHCALLEPEKDRVVVRIWNLADGTAAGPPMALPGDAPSGGRSRWVSVRFSADGRRVIAKLDSVLHIWDAPTGRQLTRLPEVFSAYSLNPGATRVAAIFGGIPGGGQARVWDVAAGRFLELPLNDDGGIADIDYSPDGRRLVTTSGAGTVRVWDDATGEPLTPPLTHPPGTVVARFSADSRKVVTRRSMNDRGGSADFGDSFTHQEFRVWDAMTGQPLCPPVLMRVVFRGLGIAPAKMLGSEMPLAGDRLLLDNGNRIGVYELSPENRPIDELRTLARVLAGRRVNDAGSIKSLDAATFVAAWQEVRGRYAGEWNRGCATGADWHRRVLADLGFSESEPNTSLELRESSVIREAGRTAALWHLERLMAAEPDNLDAFAWRAAIHQELRQWNQVVADTTRAIDGGRGSLHALRGNALGELQRWDEAAADYERDLQQNAARGGLSGLRSEINTRTALALLRLRLGQIDSYREHCEALLRSQIPRFSTACLVAPGAVKDLSLVLNYFEANSTRLPSLLNCFSLKAACEYRIGRVKEARDTLKTVSAEKRSPGDLFFLAMIQHRLGEPDEARQTLAAAVKQFEELQRPSATNDNPTPSFTWQHRIVFDALRAEAEAELKK